MGGTALRIVQREEDITAEARASATPPGLVSLSTSPTRQPERIEFDPRDARLRRMRDGIQLGVRLGEAALERPGYRHPVAWMFTLTYRQADAWEPRHVSAFIDRLCRWAGRQGFGCAGAWCAEMQDKRYRVRGELAIHYHVITWLPHGITPPKPDDKGWWRWGMTRRELVLKSATAYISKYASKGSEAPLPKGARIYGVYGLASERTRYTWLRRPLWLRELVEIGDRICRRPGGGWLCRETGEVYSSPWLCSFDGDRGRVVMMRRVA